jgi:glycosyltransferase involved in cell wall biosynthesis
MMKVAVYDRFWTTGGGAEVYAGVIADVLSRDHEVTLLGPEAFDLTALGRRLGFDLSRCTLRVVRDRPGSLAQVSETYDLLVNVGYLSSDGCRAAHGLYIALFPAPPPATPSLVQRVADKAVGPVVRSAAVDTRWGDGFYFGEGGGSEIFWTSGQAIFHVEARPDRPVPVRIRFADRRPPAAGPATVAVAVDGRRVASATVGGRRGASITVEVPARADRAEVPVVITSDTFVPAEVGGGDDHRPLGVAVRELSTGGGLRDRAGRWVGARFPALYQERPDRPFWETYDRVASISVFTQHWVQRLWGATSVVLHPPVSMQQRADKQQVILHVGRFFDAGSGHSKKQLEMVEAFRSLVERSGGPGGLAEGWELHLVGGCSEADRPYLDRVRAASAGLPVHLHVDAPREELHALYGIAAVYWHATGLGEDHDSAPERFEHFGIATVEAMSAGAVPVVIGMAGQLEVLDHGVEGFHWDTVEELLSCTTTLLEDQGRREQMSRAAEHRAQDFAVPAFAHRLRSLLDDLGAGTPANPVAAP